MCSHVGFTRSQSTDTTRRTRTLTLTHTHTRHGGYTRVRFAPLAGAIYIGLTAFDQRASSSDQRRPPGAAAAAATTRTITAIMDILTSGNIFRELQEIYDTGYLTSQSPIEDQWQQASGFCVTRLGGRGDFSVRSIVKRNASTVNNNYEGINQTG